MIVKADGMKMTTVWHPNLAECLHLASEVVDELSYAFSEAATEGPSYEDIYISGPHEYRQKDCPPGLNTNRHGTAFCIHITHT